MLTSGLAVAVYTRREEVDASPDDPTVSSTVQPSVGKAVETVLLPGVKRRSEPVNAKRIDEPHLRYTRQHITTL